MAIVTLPFTLTNGTTADADEVQANDNALREGVNNIETAQIVDSNVTNDKLAENIDIEQRAIENGIQNYIFDGLNWITVTTSPDLDYTSNAFVCYVNGVRLDVASFIHSYTALRDTYVDIDDVGALTFSEVTNGGAAPAQAAGTLRLMKVITDLTTVTDVVLLAAVTAINSTFTYEYKYAEMNLSKNVSDPNTPGNQTITLIARVKDNSSRFELSTGTSGVVVDTGIKELAGGMDEDVVTQADSVWSLWLIGASDNSQPVAGILSRQSAPFGTGNPIYPPGYDISRWICLVAWDSSANMIPGVHSGNETVLHENIKDIFPASMNNTWTIIDFESLRSGVADHVGHAYISSRSSNSGASGYANHGVTGATSPISQPGAVALTHCALTSSTDTDFTFVPLSSVATGNFWSNQQSDGTGNGNQGGATLPAGLGWYGFRYKHD